MFFFVLNSDQRKMKQELSLIIKKGNDAKSYEGVSQDLQHFRLLNLIKYLHKILMHMSTRMLFYKGSTEG